MDAADEFIAPNFVQHDPQSPIGVRGIEAYKQFARYYLNAFQILTSPWTIRSLTARLS